MTRYFCSSVYFEKKNNRSFHRRIFRGTDSYIKKNEVSSIFSKNGCKTKISRGQ